MTTITLSNYESLRSSLINTTSLNASPEDITKKFSLKEVAPVALKGLYEEDENILDKGVNKLYSKAISLVLSDKETIVTLPTFTKREHIDSIVPVEKNRPEPYIFKQFYAKTAPAVKPESPKPKTNVDLTTTVASATRKPSKYELYAEAREGIVTSMKTETIAPQNEDAVSPKHAGIFSKVVAAFQAPETPAPSSQPIIPKAEKPAITSRDSVSKNNAIIEKPAPKKSYLSSLLSWLFSWFK